MHFPDLFQRRAEGVRAGQAGFIDAGNENGGTMIRARLWCEAHQSELVAAVA